MQKIAHLEVAYCDLKFGNEMAKAKPASKKSPPIKNSESRLAIYECRGDRVVLDEDVARLFDVDTKRLNEQVRRNSAKFGDDFSFRLSKCEFEDLRSQNATSKTSWGGRRYPPRVFTEHGVVMAATILRSPKAIEATRVVVKSFVATRREVWERERAQFGDQIPLALDTPTRQGLMTKLNMALGHVVDAIADPENQKKVEKEAKAIASEGLRAIKALLAAKRIDNEVRIAEIQEILARAENIQVDTAIKRTTNEERRLALWVKKLKLIIQAQQFIENGRVDGLMAVLSELEKK